jgi:hypothetical protein
VDGVEVHVAVNFRLDRLSASKVILKKCQNLEFFNAFLMFRCAFVSLITCFRVISGQKWGPGPEAGPWVPPAVTFT